MCLPNAVSYAASEYNKSERSERTTDRLSDQRVLYSLHARTSTRFIVSHDLNVQFVLPIAYGLRQRVDTICGLQMEQQMGLFGRRESAQERDAKMLGLKSADEMRTAMTLNARQGLPHSQSRKTLEFLFEAHGRPAVEAAASMIASGEFDKRFGNRELGECLKELEREFPDPELAAIMKRMGISP